MRGILIPVAPGELIDKLTILSLKLARIGDPGKLANVRAEHAMLTEVAQKSLPESADLTSLWEELHAVNTRLWEIEDAIRACEARGDFGPDFVALARSVYLTNDRRAEVKRAINLLLGSPIVEEKSYHAYRRDGAG